jgi:hypothetical protein
VNEGGRSWPWTDTNIKSQQTFAILAKGPVHILLRRGKCGHNRVGMRGIMCNPPVTSHPKAWLPFPAAHETGERRDAYAKTRAVRVRQETSCLCCARVEWAKWHIAAGNPFHATQRSFTTHSTRNKHHVSATITPSQHGTLASLFRARQMVGNGRLRRVVTPVWPRKSGPKRLLAPIHSIATLLQFLKSRDTLPHAMRGRRGGGALTLFAVLEHKGVFIVVVRVIVGEPTPLGRSGPSHDGTFRNLWPWFCCNVGSQNYLPI